MEQEVRTSEDAFFKNNTPSDLLISCNACVSRAPVRACDCHVAWLDVVPAFRLARRVRPADTADLKVCTTPARHRHGTGGQELRRRFLQEQHFLLIF
jgi:hypothetical protein